MAPWDIIRASDNLIRVQQDDEEMKRTLNEQEKE